jgi:20S proteasome alpha/beta subunit
MTLIIGMDCFEALLFCADREESTETGGKRSVSKIHQASGDNWQMGIATSGSGPMGDIAALRIIKRAKSHEAFHSDPLPTIEKAMSEVYARYIFPRDERRQAERGISLIIGMYDEESRQRFLFKTFDEIVKPENHYACAGVGLDIAYYFLDRLHQDGMSAEEARMLTAFILREAKSSVGGVGNESEFVTLAHSGEYKGFSNRTMIGQAVDWREIPQLIHCLKPFWRNDKK